MDTTALQNPLYIGAGWYFREILYLCICGDFACFYFISIACMEI